MVGKAAPEERGEESVGDGERQCIAPVVRDLMLAVLRVGNVSALLDRAWLGVKRIHLAAGYCLLRGEDIVNDVVLELIRCRRERNALASQHAGESSVDAGHCSVEVVEGVILLNDDHNVLDFGRYRSGMVGETVAHSAADHSGSAGGDDAGNKQNKRAGQKETAGFGGDHVVLMLSPSDMRSGTDFSLGSGPERRRSRLPGRPAVGHASQPSFSALPRSRT